MVRRELDTIKKSQRNNEADGHSKDIRLNRALEELKKIKTQLNQQQSKSDEALQTAQQEITRLRTELKRAEKQRQDFVTAFKKQMQLIDVLKRQKLHLEASRVLNFTEEEFMRCLDWKP